MRSCIFVTPLTRAISGSRPYANHTARFYRESAALRCSAKVLCLPSYSAMVMVTSLLTTLPFQAFSDLSTS